MVRRLREAGAIVVGLTLLPELAICGFTESATYGRHPQPLGPAAHPGRLQRRQRRRGGGRPGPDRLGRRRRRLDPHSRRLLWPLRAEAAAWPDLAGARPRSTGTGSRSTAASAAPCSTRRSGSTSSPAAREEPGAPPPPERPFVEAAKTPPGKLRVAYSTAAPRAAGAADRLRGGQGRRRRDRRAAALARPRGRPSGIPTGAGSATTSRRASCAASPKTSPKSRTRSASNGAPAASAGSAG